MSRNNPAITLVPLTTEHLSTLVEWINAPHVARFWDGLTNLEGVKEKYGPRMAPDRKTHVFIASLNGLPIGMIQCYKQADFPEWDRTVTVENSIGIDYLIGNPDFVGKGIGPAIISEMVIKAFQLYPACNAVVSVPQQENIASCRALEKAGFKLKESRMLDSDCPSDAGTSCVYIYLRNTRVD